MPPKKRVEESEESSSDESVDVQPVSARRKFDDEEDSDDVADNWDEEEDSEAEREKAKAAAAAKAKAEAEAAKNRKPKAQRIEEHREAARRRRAAEDELEESSDEDEADKRARLRKQEQDADMKNAQDLLGAVDIHPRSRGNATASKPVVVSNTKSPGQSIDLSQIPLFKPATKTDFEALSEALVPLLRQSSSKPHYSIWINNFVKGIVQDLPSADIKKVGSQVTALSNEKMKEEKLQEKTGKKSKAAKTKTTLSAGRDVGRGNADTTAYDDDGLDDGDFM